MTLALAAFAGGLVVEYFFGAIRRTVDFAKAIWAKVRGAI